MLAFATISPAATAEPLPWGVLWAVLIASLLGSLHCAGMCGGLVLFAVGSDGKPIKRTPLHIAYHAGRGIAYTALGIAAGAGGAATDIAATINDNFRTSAIVAGVIMIILGLVALAQNAGIKGLNARLPKRLQRLADTAHRWAFGLPPLHRAAVVGALTPLLPCGWLYAFAIVAAGTGTLALGGLVMAAFWAGTLPVMGALGLGLQKLTGPLRDRLPAATSLIVIVLGVLTAMGRVGVPTAVASDLGKGTLSERVQAVTNLSHDDLLCCNPEPPHEPANDDSPNDNPETTDGNTD